MTHKVVRIEAKVFPQQYEFIASPRRLLMFSGGVNSGKTYAGCLRALRFMTALEPGAPGFVVAPTYRILQDTVLPTLRRILDEAGVRYRMWRDDLVLTNGSRAMFRSADNPDHLRGPSLAWAWIDEPADCPDDTGPIVMARLRHPFKRTLGSLWLTGTPRGKRNWVYRFVMSHAEGMEPFHVIHVRTEDNPFRPPGFVERLRQYYTPELALQELEGQFVELTGLVYPSFSPAVHVSEAAEYNPHIPVLWALDDGFTREHPRCILWAQDLDGTLHCFREQYSTYTVAEEDIRAALAAGPQPHAAYLDPSAAELASRLWSHDIDTIRPRHAVEEGIKQILALLGSRPPRLLIHPRCARLIRELQDYHRDNHGRLVKADDHGPDALRYLAWGRRFHAEDAQP